MPFFTTEIDNNGVLTTLKSIKNSKIIYVKNEDGCYSVYIGLDTGLIIDLTRIEGKLKIIKYEVVG